jgi:hypothetical protein
MTASTFRRRIALMIAAAALCTAVVECIGDLKAATPQKPDGTNQLRYYGGPKSPMWPGRTRACGADCRSPESIVLNAGPTRPQPKSAPVKPVRKN